MVIETFSPEETEELGIHFGKEAKPGTVCTLIGDLGVGWANLIEEILPEHYQQITIEKDIEKGFDYRKITIESI